MISKSLAFLLVGTLSSQAASAGWDAYEHLDTQAGNWTVYDRRAGVTGPDNTRSFLMASVHCAGENVDALRLSFGRLISGLYRLYFVSELVPAIQASRVELTISVDDDHRFPLQHHNASLDSRNHLMVSGMLMSDKSEPEALEALMSGRQVMFNLSYNGNLLLTQKFPLSNSADALTSLHCAESTTTVAETHTAPGHDEAL